MLFQDNFFNMHLAYTGECFYMNSVSLHKSVTANSVPWHKGEASSSL